MADLIDDLRAGLPTAEDGPDFKTWCCVRGDHLRAGVNEVIIQRATIATLRAEVEMQAKALQGVLTVMGPTTPPCCTGCEHEWTEALRLIRAALAAKGGT